ncbi:multidrug efflux pump subunit AcrA (membrane-fusion protein) [Paenibacillus endophyticus]|uniref:Multidrug efflux pump subunit AcrA (Membrane-fusion protein) n=1 Tax=Paenibacillus endophyticus TaxID=1294268 RepID=A0A7W5GBD9_9BACL|nr:biotin/lipoyl-binding protein [Paenibacillus endophyticus]MBB3153263.1 multidrug efflux pump subunit AcrA (membrane-fusion protein) [Paenibacillus endophyticus]
MELSKEQVERKRKKWIFAALLLLVGLLLFFTLFSNTLQSATLPKVRTELAASGGITYKLEGSGVVQPFNQAELPNPAGWRVQHVLVKEGETVKKGQKLVVYDSTSARRELEDELAQLEKLNIALEDMQDQFKLSISEGDESATSEIKREIKTCNIDISVQQRKIDGLRDQLNRQKELVAPFDGIVMELLAIEGLASTGQSDIVISNLELGYRLDIVADRELIERFGLAVRHPIELLAPAEGEQPPRPLEGVIDEIADTGPRSASLPEDGGGSPAAIQQKLLRLLLDDDALKGGEQISVKLELASPRKGWLIPNEAVHREGEEQFIFKVEQLRGALGNVFLARKVPIEESESTDRETMIPEDRLYEGEMIILESSEPLQDGNRIRLQ